MHFYNLIKELSKNEEVILFVDMDGVIASYDVGRPLDFLNKRPLTENIEKLKKISKLNNVELRILSICRKDFQIDEKNGWLDKYASFFYKENRIIISKENIKDKTSAQIKAEFLNEFETNKKMILLDDDNLVLKTVMEKAKDVIVFQDSELID